MHIQRLRLYTNFSAMVNNNLKSVQGITIE